MTLVHRFLVSALCLLPFSGIAQNWTVFNINNSEITGNTILATAADKKNNKWVGTNLGLCRFQGRTWTDFSMFNEKLKDEFVNCLTVDAKGTLWIGTDNFGVINFNGSKWTEYTAETKKLNMKFIREIAIDRNDVKWIGVTLGGLVKYDNKEWTKYTAENSGLLSDFVLCVTIDSKNRKWIGTNDGLCLFDGSKWTPFTTKNSDLPHNIVPAVVIDQNDVKWIGTLGGLVRYDGNSWTIYNKQNSSLPSNQVNDLALDENGMLWIATDQGIALFNRENSWQIFNKKNAPLPSLVIQNITIDNQGNRWFGTDFGGLIRYSGTGIRGRVCDAKGIPQEGITIEVGGKKTTTDSKGEYFIEAPTGTASTLTASYEGYSFEPAQRTLSGTEGFLFKQDFTISSGMLAKGNSTEKVVVEPFLAEGYIIIHLESATAEVEFVNEQGKSIRTVPTYKNGAKITISKMPKSNYTLFIRTPKGEKSLKFNLK